MFLNRTVGGAPTSVTDICFTYADALVHWYYFKDGVLYDKKDGSTAATGFTRAEGEEYFTNEKGLWLKKGTGTPWTAILFNPEQPYDHVTQTPFGFIGVRPGLGGMIDKSFVRPLGYDRYCYYAFTQDRRTDGPTLSSVTDGFLHTTRIAEGRQDIIDRELYSAGATTQIYNETSWLIFNRALSKEEIRHFAELLGLDRDFPDGALLGISKQGRTLEHANPIGGCRSAYRYDRTLDGAVSRHELLPLPKDDGAGFLYPYDPAEHYDALHIVNLWDEEFRVGDVFPVKAYPIPFQIEHSRPKIRYESSDPSVAVMCGCTFKCLKAGTTDIIARCGDKTDRFTITVQEKLVTEDRPYFVEESLFTDNYEENQAVIYSQIDHAAKHGFNHVIFTNKVIHVIPNLTYGTEYTYIDRKSSGGIQLRGMILPSNMTIEFKGILWFHVGALALPHNGDTSPNFGNSYIFFRLGRDVENTHIKAAHIRGERYDFRSGKYPFFYSDSPKGYADGSLFVGTALGGEAPYSEAGQWYYRSGGARRCSLEIDFSEDVIGFFVAPGGHWNFWNVRGPIPVGTKYNGTTIDGRRVGLINWDDMEHGKINEDGTLEETNEWTRVNKFIDIGYMPEIFDDYYIGRYGFYGGTACRLVRILWYDKDDNLIQCRMITVNRSGLKRPEGAVKFKITIPQSTLPTANSNAFDDVCYMRIGIGNAWDKFHYEHHFNLNNESGVYSGVGDMKGCTIANTNALQIGRHYDWSLDLEDGWYGMWDTVIWDSCFGTIANHSTNLTLFNTVVNRLISASYCTRTNLNYSSVVSVNYTAHADEKELLTFYGCDVGSEAMFDQLSQLDKVQMIGSRKCDAGNMRAYIEPFREGEEA